MKHIEMNAFCLAVAVTMGVVSFTVTDSYGATQIANEYWVSTETNTANLGTLSDPYDASTQVKFDTVMNNMPSNCAIHLLAGSYETFGQYMNSWRIKTGQKISGSGMGKTRIHLNYNGSLCSVGNLSWPDASYSTPVANVEVADLTLDSTGCTNTSGLNLFGDHIALRRVRVCNMYSTFEVFPIAIICHPSGPASVLSQGNIVEGCEVDVVALGIFSGIKMGGVSTNYIQGVIRNNRVVLAPTDAPEYDTYSSAGINVAYSRDTLIEGNYVYGADFGIYSDAGGNKNLMIHHNDFTSVFYGVHIFNHPQTNIMCSFNSISFRPSPYDCIGFDFSCPSSPQSRNICMIGNTIMLQGNPSSGHVFAQKVTYTTGGCFVNNIVDEALSPGYGNWGSVNFSMYHNTDLDGKPWRYDQDPARNILRKTVSANYAIQSTDRYIGVQTISQITLTLPDATTVGVGKEFIITQEDTYNKTTTLQPAPGSGQKINGDSSAITLSAGSNTSRPIRSATIVSDGSNWWVR